MATRGWRVPRARLGSLAVTEWSETGEADPGRLTDGDLVFISYCREDTVWRRRFEVLLAPWVRKGLEVWSDERNVAGEPWRPQLAEAIDRATLALVLVSADLL